MGVIKDLPCHDHLHPILAADPHFAQGLEVDQGQARQHLGGEHLLHQSGGKEVSKLARGESLAYIFRRIHEEKAEAEIEYALNKYRIELPENIKRRRKIMAAKNPFRNLRKLTLTKNYKIKVKREEKLKRKPLLGWWRDPRKRKFLVRPRLATRREA